MSAVKFKVVVFNNGCFIANAESYVYVSHSHYVANLFFDGVKAQPSCKKDWYKLDKVPTTVNQQGYVKTVNHRYELKETVTFDLPKVYSRDEFAYYPNDGEDWVARPEFEDVFSLYKENWDVEPAQLEDIKFHLDVIAKYDCDLIEPSDTNSFNYPCFVNGSFARTITKDNTTKVTHNSVEYLLINELTTPDLFIDNTPCCLSAKVSYDIIRFHIKQNIDNTWATLTDYDFNLTVEKNINLKETQSYEVIEHLYNKKKKPKTVTKYRDKRRVTIYEVCPSPRDGYTVVTPFKGNSLQDLKDNIDKYLTDLITEINKPLVDCPHCKGLGVVDFVDKD
jgi:hypothetical protein